MHGVELIDSLFGVDAGKLEQHSQPTYPDTVAGRTLHIDGDFLAYQVAGDDSKPLSEMKHNHDVAVEVLRLLAGAEFTVLHLTDKDSTKGNRYSRAVQKEYQCNRKDREKPKYLYTIKAWMQEERGAISHKEQEADDGLCQSVWDAVQAGTPELAVLTSKDKDLQMCTGWHMDWDTGDLEYVDGFGYIELDRSKSSPKIVGKGTAFFWAQMLMGDTADNIAGLPTVSGRVQDIIKPTKTSKPTERCMLDSTATYEGKRKAGKCGVVSAYEILKDVSNDIDALVRVTNLYRDHGERVGFTHWETGEPVPWQEAFKSEAVLLWMRRTKDDNDFEKFMKGITSATKRN